MAGCGEANNAARCCVYDVAEEATKASPLHQLAQFVDEFKQYGHATGEQELLAVMLPAANTFVTGVKSSNFVFSKKSAILSSSTMVAKVLHDAALAAGVDVKIVDDAKDLGVDTSSKPGRRLPGLRGDVSLPCRGSRRSRSSP